MYLETVSPSVLVQQVVRLMWVWFISLTMVIDSGRGVAPRAVPQRMSYRTCVEDAL